MPDLTIILRRIWNNLRGGHPWPNYLNSDWIYHWRNEQFAVMHACVWRTCKFWLHRRTFGDIDICSFRSKPSTWTRPEGDAPAARRAAQRRDAQNGRLCCHIIILSPFTHFKNLLINFTMIVSGKIFLFFLHPLDFIFDIIPKWIPERPHNKNSAITKIHWQKRILKFAARSIFS